MNAHNPIKICANKDTGKTLNYDTLLILILNFRIKETNSQTILNGFRFLGILTNLFFLF